MASFYSHWMAQAPLFPSPANDCHPPWLPFEPWAAESLCDMRPHQEGWQSIETSLKRPSSYALCCSAHNPWSHKYIPASAQVLLGTLVHI